ncbi:alpha/beta hydrolase [Agromyces sp. SYSU K20354]|uniref:alpha/beta fold hydrolase n=1 Tax=Agromyces cavernae TaxID=2898659 RepID=UPI001E32998C|nr:alpha/beta fold hydrolase [Agromyces cavernae]MCD2442020.1 alpha/beta hydrolase [Agromyces cavernae]
MSTTIQHAFAPFTAMLRRPAERRRNARALVASTTEGVDRREWVRLGGVDQWITIRSASQGNPVLLVIPGGPASPYIPFNPQLQAWERIFTVVQWDQRGVGRTFVRNGADAELTLARLAADGVELARWLTRELGTERIVLMGSSVGTVITAQMAMEAPELFSQLVGANQVGVGSRAASWRETRAELERRGKRKRVAALDAIGPDPLGWTPAQAEEVSKHAIAASPQVPDMVYDLMLPALMFTPDYSMSDIRAIGKSMEIARDELYAELCDPDVAGRYEIPVLMVHGEGDLVNPVSAVRALLPRVDSPRTELVTVPDVGHLVEFAAVERFAGILEEKVLQRTPR